MGNELGVLIEQNATPSEEGTSFVLTNLKKKIKAKHVKLVTQKLPNLTSLTITSSALKTIPPELTSARLKDLNLPNNAIKQLPKAFNTMFESVVALDLSKNALKEIDENTGLEKMACLRRLNLDENKFTELPRPVLLLSNVVRLQLSRNLIERVPSDLQHLQKLTQLRLDGNRLTEFPAEVLAKLPHLKILDLSYNQLSTMTLGKGHDVQSALQVLNLSHNELQTIPKVVFKCASLKELHADNNKLTAVPEKLARLSQLKVLLLNNNKISEIPFEMLGEKLTEIQTFDIKDNPLNASTLEFITKFGVNASLALLRPALKAKLEDQKSHHERPTRRRTSGLSKLPSFVGSPRAPAAPAPPPAPLLAPPPPRQGAGCEVSPRQKFRNSAANQSRVIPSVEGDASPEFFALRLEDTKKEVSCDEMLALYDKLVHQPYAWVDAFIAAKGLSNLLNFIERNAKQLSLVNNDASKLHFEALHCYKLFIRVKLNEVLSSTGCIDALAFSLLPNILPSLRKIAAKLLIELSRIKMAGRKKILLALEKVRRYLAEKGNEEAVLHRNKRERFRLLVNLLGHKEEQDGMVIYKERNKASIKEAVETPDEGEIKLDENERSSAPAVQSQPNTATSEEETGEQEARRLLRLFALRLINAILNVTSNITARIFLRKCLIDLGILDRITWVESSSASLPEAWELEVDSFETFMEEDNEDLEYMLQRKGKKAKKKKRKRTPSIPKKAERSTSIGMEAPNSPVEKLRQVRRLNSISNLNRLAAASKSTEEIQENNYSDTSDSDDDASSTDPTTGDTAFTENDDTYPSDEEGEDNWEEEQVTFEDYIRVKVVTLGTSLHTPTMAGSKGHLIVPIDASKTIGDVIHKIKVQYPGTEGTKFEWGLFILPTEANPDGLWPDESRHCGYYDLKGQVLAEFRLKPWILRISCNATDVINTLTLTKMRFDPHRMCADAVALVRSRFPHVSAWEEYDWGLYWHKGKSGGTSLVQKSPTPPPAPAPDTPKKGLRRRTTLSKKEKKKLEEDAQKARELQNSPQIGRETNAQPVQEERMWLVDTERLTAYPDLYMTDDLLELKMKLMGIKVKILAQEAVEFMQLDPMHKVEDIIRDLGGRVLPDSEKRNYTNYGLYLQRANPDKVSTWLQEDKKLNAYKFGPEDCLCYLARKKPVMVLVYSEKLPPQNTKSEKYGTFSRSASRLFNKAQIPIYTHFPVDFMVPVSEVKETVATKVSTKCEEYELYFRKTGKDVVLLDESSSLHTQQVEPYSRLLFVKKGVFGSVEELVGAMGDKEDEDSKPNASASDQPTPAGADDREEELPDENNKKVLFEEDTKNEVKAGSLAGLIDHLIVTPIYEPEYTKAFLLTHHAFTSSRVVLDYVIKRYYAYGEEIAREPDQEPSKPEGGGKESSKKDDKKISKGDKEDEISVGKEKAEKIQRRILYLLKVWVDEFFYDFYDEDQLLEKLIEFLNKAIVKEGHSSGMALHQRILQSIEANTMGTTKEKQHTMDPAPLARIPRPLDKPNWFIIDEVELARQLSIRSYELFSAIRLFEFFGQPWSKSSTQHLAPNLMAFIEYFNTISRAVSTALLQQKKIRERVKLLARFIHTAEELRDLGNYHLLQAFIAGFSNSAVSRLQWTKARLPKNSALALQELEGLMSMNYSFKNYRTRIANANPPLIPYIGVCLQDLTFIEDGNRNKVDNLINFSKHKLVYDVISRLEKFQKSGYNFQRVEEIQNFLNTPIQFDDKQLYDLSLKVEPRNAGRSDIQ